MFHSGEITGDYSKYEVLRIIITEKLYKEIHSKTLAKSKWNSKNYITQYLSRKKIETKIGTRRILNGRLGG